MNVAYQIPMLHHPLNFDLIYKSNNENLFSFSFPKVYELDGITAIGEEFH